MGIRRRLQQSNDSLRLLEGMAHYIVSSYRESSLERVGLTIAHCFPVALSFPIQGVPVEELLLLLSYCQAHC